MGRPEEPIPRWVRNWMMFTCALFYYDGSFCVLRPMTLPGGSLYFLYRHMYSLYIELDQHYADPSDSLVFALGVGSIVDATLHLAVLLNILHNPRHNTLLAIVTNVMVCWKTFMFHVYSMDIPKGGHESSNFWLELLIVFVTSWFWVIVPALAAYSMAKDLHEPSPRKMGRPEEPIPRWMKYWMIFTCALLYYDGFFCVLRPMTLPGGSLYYLYRHMFSLYLELEPHYADPSDSFVFALGVLNIVEATLHLAVLLNFLQNSRRTKLMALLVNVMVFWKTLLTIAYKMDIPKGGHESENFWLEVLIVYVISWIWVIVSALCAYTLAKDFLEPSPKKTQ